MVVKRILSLFAVVALSARGAIAASGSETDAALRDFDFVVAGVRNDYAGFEDKTKGDGRAAFEADVAVRRAAIAGEPAKFLEETRAVLDWFKDGHLVLQDLRAASAQPPAQEDSNVSKAGRLVPIDDAMLRRTVAATARSPSPLGVWESWDGVYRVAVLKDPDARGRWLGVILDSKAATWSRGQVKFEIVQDIQGRWSGILRLRNHKEQEGAVRFFGPFAAMRFDPIGSLWKRVAPEPRADLARYVPSDHFFLKPLSNKTSWLRIPNFSLENRAKIEALLAENSALLAATPNLVIDLRDNSGGGDSSYDALMGWLYTRPIYSVGVEFRDSEVNMAMLESLSRRPELPREILPDLQRLIAGMREKEGGWVSLGERPISIKTYPSIKPNPKRVGVLISGAGSSGEQFVLDARASRKVTLFGANTAGVLDYSNQLERDTPSGKYRFKWASSRSMRLPEEPVDVVGIAPDIPIGDTIDDPIEVIQLWLERQVD